MSRLSPLQIKALIAEARKAFAHVGAQARARGEAWDDSKESFDQFRHRQVFEACGQPGLSKAANDHFNLIKARFLTLQAEDGRALEAILRAGSERPRQLTVLIERELARAGLPETYANSIAQDRFGIAHLEDLAESQLEQLLFTVRNRLAARRRKAAEWNPCPSLKSAVEENPQSAI